MSKLSLTIEGNFNFNLNKYPYLNTNTVQERAKAFIKSQYPSKILEGKDVIHFSNNVIRVKVNRARNVLRAFHTGKIEVARNKDQINIAYSGKLTRGLTVSALHTIIVSLVFAFSAPMALYFAPLFFALNYFLQVYLTHVVFPMNLGKAFQELLVSDKDENT